MTRSKLIPFVEKFAHGRSLSKLIRHPGSYCIPCRILSKLFWSPCRSCLDDMGEITHSLSLFFPFPNSGHFGRVYIILVVSRLAGWPRSAEATRQTRKRRKKQVQTTTSTGPQTPRSELVPRTSDQYHMTKGDRNPKMGGEDAQQF